MVQTELIVKPEEIEIRQKSVLFSHLKHETMECIACRHTSGGTEVEQECPGTGCHVDFKKRKQPDGPIDCKGCHIQE
ncbi:cytochrome c3 family protein [Desulfonatronum thioautotrophicum]|uniref:cytochrome c3 family protein n=1 Tax=Desulfonatronum thioautotrophicum TaxID=617001 RepID=UPI0005EB29DB|nr:cytochrome c3 family protein [Desulfonatronum thioautotrophicum]